VKIPGIRVRGLALASAVALSVLGLATAVAPAAVAAPKTPKPVLVDCITKGAVEPTMFIITCADGNDALEHLTWSHWGAATASGKGTEFLNNCVPTCVGGTFHKFGVKIALSRVRPRPHHRGQRYFTRMKLTYTKKVPHGFSRHRTIKLWASP
jgi:hypothetical protein